QSVPLGSLAGEEFFGGSRRRNCLGCCLVGNFIVIGWSIPIGFRRRLPGTACLESIPLICHRARENSGALVGDRAAPDPAEPDPGADDVPVVRPDCAAGPYPAAGNAGTEPGWRYRRRAHRWAAGGGSTDFVVGVAVIYSGTDFRGRYSQCCRQRSVGGGLSGSVRGIFYVGAGAGSVSRCSCLAYQYDKLLIKRAQ